MQVGENLNVWQLLLLLGYSSKVLGKHFEAMSNGHHDEQEPIHNFSKYNCILEKQN